VSGFGAQVSSFATSAEARVLHVRRQFCIALFIAIVKATPVDTGRLRGNWQCSVVSPALSQLPLRSATEVGQEIIAMTRVARGDESIILRNNLVYVVPIEFDGHSQGQAPFGMVRINVARASKFLEDALRKGSLS
jgi:hypothetical protein